MKALLLNPWAYLIAVAVLLGAFGGGYRVGHTAAATSCAAKGGKAVSKAAAAGEQRDQRVEAIGQSTAAATGAALTQNRSDTDESVARIRTVVVPGACRDVDPGVLRELRAARDGVNAALGVGVRPGAAGPGAAHP